MKRFLAAALIVCVAGAGVPLPATAGVVATDAVTASAERERIHAALAREDVRAKLEALGVKPADVQARVDALSDEEAAKLAAEIDALPAGGDGIIGAILVVFVVLLITDILGWTKVFPFTRAQR
jgi:hypothetical protein